MLLQGSEEVVASQVADQLDPFFGVSDRLAQLKPGEVLYLDRLFKLSYRATQCRPFFQLQPGASFISYGVERPRIRLIDQEQLSEDRPLTEGLVLELTPAGEWLEISEGKLLVPGTLVNFRGYYLCVPLPAEVGRVALRFPQVLSGGEEGEYSGECQRGEFALISHRGHFDEREHNEDGALVADRCQPTSSGALEFRTLLAVADGVGGSGAGEVASAVALSALAYDWTVGVDLLEVLKHGLPEALKSAHAELSRPEVETGATNGAAKEVLEEESSAGMGSCLVVAEIRPGAFSRSTRLSALFGKLRSLTGQAFKEALTTATVRMVHIGDCQGILVRQNSRVPALRTEPHTLLRELSGKYNLTEEQILNSPYKNVVSRALMLEAGAANSLRERQPETMEFGIGAGDTLVLTSDGCVLSAEEIAVYVQSYQSRALKDLLEALSLASRQKLVETGRAEEDDNLSIVVYRHS